MFLLLEILPGSSPLARGTRHRRGARPGALRFIPARAGNTGCASRRSSSRTVHPRSRGEHPVELQQTAEDLGSSPLARGTRLRLRLLRLRLRFIPARAGNTWPREWVSPPPTVHPRSRGEHYTAESARKDESGSSPLARGTLRGRPGTARRPGFIPARAGNTGDTRGDTDVKPVHPRSRGEHYTAESARKDKPGSSPLARGTRGARGGHDGLDRFIPARAGNTTTSATRPRPPPVHPRSRGEHATTGELSVDRLGSSPLARGTRCGRRCGRRRGRFIPARAGNTCEGFLRQWNPMVHPRSRGEHGASDVTSPAGFGSSPLARGTLLQYCERDCRTRFIPARAGNTRCTWTDTRSESVHPRSRGEHRPRGHRARTAPGSSPLARGTPPGRGRGRERLRFIPARAGNTPRSRDVAAAPTVHPRSRGEHPDSGSGSGGKTGSSPLARGTHLALLAVGVGARFIPARAGNT